MMRRGLWCIIRTAARELQKDRYYLNPEKPYLFKELYKEIMIRKPEKVGFLGSRYQHIEPNLLGPSALRAQRIQLKRCQIDETPCQRLFTTSALARVVIYKHWSVELGYESMRHILLWSPFQKQ